MTMLLSPLRDGMPAWRPAPILNASAPQAAAQCVIWFGRPQRHERQALSAAGWQVRCSALSDCHGVGLRGGDTVVGLLDLRGVGAAQFDSLAAIAVRFRHLPLFAISPRERAGETDRLLAQCVATLDAPPDMLRLIDHLDACAPGAPVADGRGFTQMLGHSPVMRETQARIHKYAHVDLPVLVTGETGTGKEVAAKALHALSARRDRPFLAINCGALPAGLVQSELFGHERGAFTGATARRAGLFESADGGTVFLDEVGDLPLEAQGNLLRVLQEARVERVGSHEGIPVDVRVLAATNVDLEKAVARGSVRRDLYYRLNVLRLDMPRLAQRGQDIVLLARHFLGVFRTQHGARARDFSDGAIEAMLRFDWPGNVRELLNRVMRASVIAESESITAEDLDLAAFTASDDDAGELEAVRAVAEREAVLACLQESGFNISEAARRLKVSRVTVYRLCRKHGLVLTELR